MHIFPFSCIYLFTKYSFGKIRQRRMIHEIPFQPGQREQRGQAPYLSGKSDVGYTKCELENAYAGFDYVTDPDLIDCYIYEQNAVMKRYKYLLQKAASLKASEQAVSG